MRTNFATLRFPDRPREKMRAALLAAGTPPQCVDEVVDIACHAADTARCSMLEVLDRSSAPGVGVASIGLALALVRADAEHLEEGVMHAARAVGLKTFQANIGGNADG